MSTMKHAAACVLMLFTQPLVAQTFCNNAAIAIPESGPASLYPSTVIISGVTTAPVTVTVAVKGLSHKYPGELDMLLVAPGGESAMVIQSDRPGGGTASGWSYTITDSGVRAFGTGAFQALGSYRPANVGAGDAFPAPAPTIYAEPAPLGDATLRSTFGGLDPNGAWRLYVVDDTGGDVGSIAQGWCLTMGTAADATPLRISEFRLHGPDGPLDEYVELMNVSDQPLTIAALDGSTGYSVVASDRIMRCGVPNGAVIPAFGHYLCANDTGYSLSGYPAGNGTTATCNSCYVGNDIPDNAGIALFAGSNASAYVAPMRVDAVGSTAETNTLYREGAGYPTQLPFQANQAWVRDDCGKAGAIGNDGPCSQHGVPRDSNNNSADFIFMDVGATEVGAGERLGAPGPQNLSSPVFVAGVDDDFTATNLDDCAAPTAAPNLRRDLTAGINAAYGTLSVQRTFTNHGDAPIARLRFRIIDLTTAPAPNDGDADLRTLTSNSLSVIVDRPPCGMDSNIIIVPGTTLEQPPNQLYGGGFNSTLSVPSVTASTPLASGASIDLRFVFGVMEPGRYRIALVPETLPAVGALQEFRFEGCTDGDGVLGCTEALFADGYE